MTGDLLAVAFWLVLGVALAREFALQRREDRDRRQLHRARGQRAALRRTLRGPR